ncbi:MAG: hypothetical protein U0165_10285 [Polyangiaceae bacterium]
MFDPRAAQERVEKLWSLPASFGKERSANFIYLNEIVSDRYSLVHGMQFLRDELQFAGKVVDSDIYACGADLSLPSVVTTLAQTSCGDRITHCEASEQYHDVMIQRFATMAEFGGYKAETFYPMGGGIDDGATLAGVTWDHQLDSVLRERIYAGNDKSFVLVNADLMTHVGRIQQADGTEVVGMAQEAPWRQPRTACGAMMGTLYKFDQNNSVHRRLRNDLGEDNYAFLTKVGVRTPKGVDVTPAVAAAIVALKGMSNTAKALSTRMDERGVAHLTATITVNRVSRDDTVIYLARATVFQGEVRMQGLGLDARGYSGDLVEYKGERRLQLSYEHIDEADHPVMSRRGG